jgi:hypothetical protein
MSNADEKMTAEKAIHEESRSYQKVRDQAKRYLEACYGKSVWFRAPETFENAVERWIWSVASGEIEFAEDCMAKIEEMAAQRG